MPRQLILEQTIYTLEQLEPLDAPQVALAGRSNVGKSSLINSLAGRKGLAKISSTPGKTRSLNYYRVEPDAFYLVDLPGYGYARCSKTERAKWARLIQTYLKITPRLEAVVALLDSRLTPQKNDMDLIAYIRNLGITLIPILTKADKCKQRERAKIQQQWQRLLDTPTLPMCVSSKSGMNRDKLWELLARTAGVAPAPSLESGPDPAENS
ncbi:MAG TPA: ribosome biogenesis GTP-binding protein YihA/YsxC [Desulfomicrobiaceae bacterium]|nr:ribosome biogenesis GTP-binding protein YihA/YsxC [Desulfomicrobiaceae bacterium]